MAEHRDGESGRAMADVATTLESISDSVAPVSGGDGDRDGDGARAEPPGERLTPGTRIDHFVVLEPLGSGGMGVVVAAYDTRLDRRVALKLLRPGDPDRPHDSAAQLRLLREAQAMARLSHPNVVVVHEVGTLGDQVYVAMEYVAGETLGAWSAREPRDWREVLDVVGQAGRGLAAAHQAGLIHRDFKPGNVLVGADGRVRVTDFGLVATAGVREPEPPDPGTASRARAGQAPLDVTLTGTGALLGTPRYMAPEQHDRQPLTAAADQFAYCVTLYEALYREHPFAGHTYGELVESIAAGRVRSAPRDTAVPAWLREVVVRGLAVEPDHRHPSMAALLVALARDPRLVRRRRWLVAGAAAGLVAGAAVAALAVTRAPGSSGGRCAGAADHLRGVWDGDVAAAVTRAFTATPRRYAAATAAQVGERLDRYAGQLTAMRRDACVATRVRGEQSDELLDLRTACLERRTRRLEALTSLFAAGPDPAVVDNAIGAVESLPDVADCADADALRAAYPPPARADTRARVEALHARLDQATAAYTAGKYETAHAIAIEVTAAARRIDHPPLLADALWHLGNGHQTAGELAQAEAAFAESARVAAVSRDDSRVAESLLALMYVIGAEQARAGTGLTLAPAVEAAVARAGDPPMLVARMHEYLGDIHALAEDGAAAGRHLDQALDVYRQVKGTDNERTAHVIDSQALLLLGAGEVEEAQARHAEALATLERLLGPEHPAVGRALYHFASSLHEAGRYQEARTYYERALEIDREAFGPGHPNLAYTLNALGELLHTLGDEDAARHHLEAALALWEKGLGPDHPLLTFPLRNLGEVLDATGHLDEAAAMYRRALAVAEQALGPDHGDVADVVHAMAGHELLAGRLDEARRLDERALTIWQRQGTDHPYVAHALTGLAEIELAARRPAQAIAPLEHALAIRTASGGDPTELGRTRFALARALWDTGRDRARATLLARQARADWRDAGPRSHDQRPAIDAWLARHAP